MSSISDELISKIGGSVVASKDPSYTLKKWRERLSIKQIDLANLMKMSSSVISDYESGRRPSPGINFVRRYIEAIINLDNERGKLLEKLIDSNERKAILNIGEFRKPIPIQHILDLVGGKILCGESNVNLDVYGYTILDSIRTIYSLSGFDFYKIFGATTERVLVFTKVGLGRSPLVAIRVSQFKPRMVILHGPKAVDKIALDLANKENIVLTLSALSQESDFSTIFENL
jgi:putative transcriptional regulator